jgi:hypothetical protein
MLAELLVPSYLYYLLADKLSIQMNACVMGILSRDCSLSRWRGIGGLPHPSAHSLKFYFTQRLIHNFEQCISYTKGFQLILTLARQAVCCDLFVIQPLSGNDKLSIASDR